MNKTLGNSLSTGLLTILSLAFASTGHADGMAGISLGQAFYDDATLVGHGLEGDTRGTSYKIHGGMALGNHLSAHAGLFSLGKISSSRALTKTVIDPNTNTSVEVPDGTATSSLEVNGFFLEGRWQWRAGEAWRPYVKLATTITKTTFQTSTTPLSTGLPTRDNEESRSSLSLVPGAGLVYETLHHWGMQLEVESYRGVKPPNDIPDQNINNASLGVYGYW